MAVPVRRAAAACGLVLALVSAFGTAPAGAAAGPAAPPPTPRFWALIVGVGEYQAGDRGIPNLDYASADARALADALREPTFGVKGIPPERLRVLLDRDATSSAIRAGLREFLARAAQTDVVLVFFAGHGAPDPHRPADLYLLAHDSEPRDLPHSAIPMAEVAEALRRLRAERVLVLADACHSAGIMPAGIRFRSALDENPVNRLLADLAKVRRNRLVVTSSAADERSMEGTRWRHGVFTWAVLRGLRGAADAAGNRDGVVQLGELVSYVRDTVESESLRRQHPVVGGEYDGRLPLALAQAGAAAAAADEAVPPEEDDRAVTFRPVVDLGALVVEPRIVDPNFVFLRMRRRSTLRLPRAERVQLPTAARLLDAWLEAQRRLVAAARSRGERLRAWDARHRRPAAPGGVPPAPDAAARRERARLEARLDRPLAAAAARGEAARRALLRTLEQLLASHAAAVPGTFWLAAVEAELEEENARFFAALEEHQRRLAGSPAASVPPEPRRDLTPAIRLLDRFIDLHRHHPARADALYLRAWLAQEAGGSAVEVAGHCLQAVAEFPDHPLAGEAYLLMGDGYFDAGHKLWGLAREAYVAALARATRPSTLRSTVRFKLGWLLYLQGDLAAARERFVQFLTQDRDVPRDRADAEAVTFLAAITAELGDATALEGAPLPAARRAEILAGAAARAAEDTEDARAVSWWERALAVDPENPGAPEWDAGVVRALIELGRRAEATARRAGRFQRFGPNSPWFGRHGRTRPPAFLKGLAAESAQAATPPAPPPRLGALAGARAHVLRRVGLLRRCYEAELRRDPRAAGTVEVELQWDDGGIVRAVHVRRSTLGAAAPLRCLRRALRRGSPLHAPAGAAAFRLDLQPG